MTTVPSPARDEIGRVAVTDPARLIDHTSLSPTATRRQIDRLCDEAIEYGFASVCVNPNWVPEAAKRLADVGTVVGTVIGFPLGADGPALKAEAARRMQDEGATELDMVIDIGALLGGETGRVRDDIAAVVEVRRAGHIVKAIIETCYLDEGAKRLACRIALEAGADFVKTSTGFGSGGASLGDIILMREECGRHMKVKASGGIRDHATLVAMIEAGADRIGTSAGVAIVEESRR